MTDKERQEFADTAEEVGCRIAEDGVVAFPRRFQSGSVGWHANGKARVGPWRVQVNIILTVIGSKPGDTLPASHAHTESPASPPPEDFTSPLLPADAEADQLFSKPPDRTESPLPSANGEKAISPAKGRRKRS